MAAHEDGHENNNENDSNNSNNNNCDQNGREWSTWSGSDSHTSR